MFYWSGCRQKSHSRPKESSNRTCSRVFKECSASCKKKSYGISKRERSIKLANHPSNWGVWLLPTQRCFCRRPGTALRLDSLSHSRLMCLWVFLHSGPRPLLPKRRVSHITSQRDPWCNSQPAERDVSWRENRARLATSIRWISCKSIFGLIRGCMPWHSNERLLGRVIRKIFHRCQSFQPSCTIQQEHQYLKLLPKTWGCEKACVRAAHPQSRTFLIHITGVLWGYGPARLYILQEARRPPSWEMEWVILLNPLLDSMSTLFLPPEISDPMYRRSNVSDEPVPPVAMPSIPACQLTSYLTRLKLVDCYCLLFLLCVILVNHSLIVFLSYFYLLLLYIYIYLFTFIVFILF